ncbi:hypothetical protein LEP3755_65590 (plasmid) [Leptolyngbya sp. NIES-3755]|nr:hypothetical protein LEP3755_65590 [Leptolyngbya sp. NIES-3755]
MRLSGHLNQLMKPHSFDEIGEFVRPNRLIHALWEGEQPICLDASEIVPYTDGTGFDVFFSLRDRKIRGQATIDALNDRGNEFSVLCGCIKDLKFEYDRVNPHRIKTAMVFRKKPKTTSKDEVASLWIPAQQFDRVYAALRKPTTRIMGALGEGKGIFVNLLLAIEANQPNPAIVRLHDPMDGSEQDYWHIAKTSRGEAETLKAIEAFVAEVDQRVESKIAEPRTIDVFDEIDRIADRKDGKGVNTEILNSTKGMRHIGMKAYVIGQSPSVGKKGMEWADMDNYNAVYFGTAVVTAIEKTPAFSTKKEGLKKRYDKLKEYCDSQNEELGLEGWNEKRLGLLVTGGKAEFFELPDADAIACDWSKLPTKIAQIQAETKTSLPQECQHLNSVVQKTQRNESGIPVKRYRKCKDCGASFTESL